jgi:predicted nucleic acid-binding protein
MKRSAYLETTIPNFLIGEVSPVPVTAEYQAATKKWWDERRHKYALFTSVFVEQELAAGTSEYVSARLDLLADVPRLPVDDDVRQLARRIEGELRLPTRRAADAVHLAVACHHKMNYLLTWNLKHIASEQARLLVIRLHKAMDIGIPTICTPEELLVWETEP